MSAVALLLAATTAALLWPVPVLLARSPVALRHPVAALLLWQAIGLASGLAAVGTGVAFGLGVTAPDPLRYAALGGATGLGAYLLAVAGWVTVRTVAQRRRHRRMLDLVSTPLPALPGGRVLDASAVLAYSLPGLRPRLVLTSGAIAGLSPDALAAVLAHERAHLDQRHDLVVLPFVAWQASFPFLPGARTARAAVALLVEALADDAARASVGPEALGEALGSVAMLSGPPGAGVDDPDVGPALAVRLARLGTAAAASR